MENEKKDLKSRFSAFFDFNRDNRPDAEDEDTTPTVKRYFKLLGRRFWKLISLNIMMLPMVIPIFLIIYLYIGFQKTPTENHVLFSALYGANIINPSIVTTTMLDLFGLQLEIPIYNTSTYIWMAVCALFLLVTFGWQNVGSSYVLRGMVRGEPVFLISDYFYAIRRNLKQGFFLGLIDALILGVLAFDFMYFYSMIGTFAMDLCFYGICALAILYFFMRFYLYLMLVTFELSIRKLMKNALIFVMLGIKRNLMGALGIILLTAINVVLMALLLPFNIAIPLILPVLYYLSFTAFTSAYAAYPVIDRYMIAPFVSNAIDEEELIAEDTEN